MDNRWEMNPINLDISRSKQKINYTIPTSFNLGELIPLDVIEVLPGSTHSFDVDSLIRMSTPIAPLMSDIYLDLYAFFVPNRLVWEHWEEFCGANKTGAWFDSEFDDAVPAVAINPAEHAGNITLAPGLVKPTSFGRTLASYMGINFGGSSTADTDIAEVSVLEGRGYFVIYNEWFRNENFIPPYAVNLSSNAEILVGDGLDSYYPSYYAGPLLVSKFMDIFTGCLPAPQKGDSVLLPLSGFAPVLTDPTGLGQGYTYNPLTFKSAISGVTLTDDGYLKTSSGGTLEWDDGVQNPAQMVPSNLVADVSKGVEVTINQLRYAFAVQKALEKDARGGTRYYEMLKAHFGVTSPDGTLQRPEYLGGKRIPINIQQVVSTAGHANSSSTSLGVPGANSVTGDNAHLFTKSFTEFGFIYIMCCARMKEVYSQGTKRQFFRKNRFDYYYPVFANIGEQPIYIRELFNQGGIGAGVWSPNDIFGYQEAWAEYRYIPSRVSGMLNPAYTGSLSFWTAAEVFDTTSTLSIGQRFMEADRTALSRCLVTGATGPDFVADFAIQDVAVLPMPLYSIPGLIDHH